MHPPPPLALRFWHTIDVDDIFCQRDEYQWTMIWHPEKGHKNIMQLIPSIKSDGVTTGRGSNIDGTSKAQA